MHVGDGFHFATAIFQHNFAEVHSTASGRHGPENVGQIFEAELGGLIQSREFCLNLGAAALVLDFGLAAGLLHQLRALKIDLGGAAGAAVIHGFGGARNSFSRAARRVRLTEHWSSQNAEYPG